MNKTRLALFGLCLAAAVSTAAIAFAGYNTSDPVSVFEGSASGAFYDARYQAGNVAYIGCEIQAQSTEVGQPLGVCYAKDASGTVAACATRDPEMLATIRTLGVGSRIWFRAAADTTCWQIFVTNASSTMN